MGKPLILFLTCPEHGQSNVHLALISSIQRQHPSAVAMHLASYAELKPRCPSGVTFHTVDSTGRLDNDGEHGEKRKKSLYSVTYKPGLFPAIRAMCDSFSLFHPESASSYISTADSITALLERLNPTLVVVDQLFDAARDAVVKGRWRSVRLSPNTIKDVAMDCQGWGIFRWPCFASGYPFPLPWYLFFPNAIGLILPIIYLNFSRSFASFNLARNKAGYPGVVPLYSCGGPFPTKVLCMSTPEADLPAIIPDKIVCCGPILQAVSPLAEIDHELDLWLAQRQTILISLGSHLQLSHSYATNLLRAISHLLASRLDVQVLWKLVSDGSYDHEEFSREGELGVEMERWGERLKVVRWLKAEPLAILNTGKIICFVNHGGSNSYHEALAAGVPQILLPAWLDCYDFASRVEYLQNGVWGNKSSAPSCSTPELIHAFDQIVGLSLPSTSSYSTPLSYRQRALELQAIVTRDGIRHGRDVAATVIWEEMEMGLMWGGKYVDEVEMDDENGSVMAGGGDGKSLV
ncbi:hypothetical protein IAR50_006154 [Cryptococcus sp. DSM 104548]